MNGLCRLSDITPGQRAKIISLEGPLHGRLAELGFIPGAVIECMFRSPLGDPSAFLAGGALIALRREDICDIAVEVML